MRRRPLPQAEQVADHHHPHDEPPWERKCARAILRLAAQFPGDSGAMAPFFLNYLLIAPGESFFMAANEPHAYVAGEIIECMACSDNVVRAGLTPKFKDVENLVSMLTYSMGGPSIDAGAPCGDPRILRYTPPVPEFEVCVASCNPGEELTIPNLKVPSIFIVIEGAGNTLESGWAPPIILRPGRSYYVPVGAEPLTLRVGEAAKGPLRIAIAHQNLHQRVPIIAPKRGKLGSSGGEPNSGGRGGSSFDAGTPPRAGGGSPAIAGLCGPPIPELPGGAAAAEAEEEDPYA